MAEGLKGGLSGTPALCPSLPQATQPPPPASQSIASRPRETNPPAASDPRTHARPELIVVSPPQPRRPIQSRRPPPTRILPPSRHPRLRSAVTTPSIFAAAPAPRQSAKFAHAASVLAATPLHYNYEENAQHFAGAALDPATGNMCEIGALLKGSEGAAWEIASANEIGRLSQEVGTRIPKGTNTIFFIPHDKKPKNKKATYIRIVATDRPQKTENQRV